MARDRGPIKIMTNELLQMEDIKLLVSIKSSPRHHKRQDAIRQTWGQSFIDHGAEVFFTISDQSCSNPYLDKDILHTPGIDNHMGLTIRMIWLMYYLKDIEFSHVATIDDDCYVNVPLFMTLPWRESKLYGHNNGGYLAGCCTVWSKEATAAYFPTMSFDDVSYSALLRHKGIPFTPCDKGVIKPWLDQETKYKIKEGTAVQHYCRTAEQIIENHDIITKQSGP
jgi:hypothetical protein